ncbi:RDD family protein [Rhodoferax sp. GW822-FHT02A01]|uniref:RDD family protein n=1 Tax=Rhodoferax sp. GW822-FHT02A01 TaxID=3141537 RepID=UPI00315D4982
MNANDLEYVGFLPRVGATVIDVLLQLAIAAPLTYAVYGRFSSPGLQFMGGADFLINFLLPAALVIWLWVRWGATPGKMAMSARIVDADSGAPLTTGRSAIRYLGYFLSMIPFGVGFLWVAFDRRKQGWHDKIANSVVVRPAGAEKVKFKSDGDWRRGSDQSRGPTEPTL